MRDFRQLTLFDFNDDNTEKQVHNYILDLLKQNRMPSAFELIKEAEMRKANMELLMLSMKIEKILNPLNQL